MRIFLLEMEMSLKTFKYRHFPKMQIFYNYPLDNGCFENGPWTPTLVFAYHIRINEILI